MPSMAGQRVRCAWRLGARAAGGVGGSRQLALGRRQAGGCGRSSWSGARPRSGRDGAPGVGAPGTGRGERMPVCPECRTRRQPLISLTDPRTVVRGSTRPDLLAELPPLVPPRVAPQCPGPWTDWIPRGSTRRPEVTRSASASASSTARSALSCSAPPTVAAWGAPPRSGSANYATLASPSRGRSRVSDGRTCSVSAVSKKPSSTSTWPPPDVASGQHSVSSSRTGCFGCRCRVGTGGAWSRCCDQGEWRRRGVRRGDTTGRSGKVPPVERPARRREHARGWLPGSLRPT